MFRKMLRNLRTYLRVSHCVVLNDTDILVHLLLPNDMVIMSSTPHGLQLDGLFQFCSHYQMIVNTVTVKAKVMIFGSHNNVNFTLNNKSLDIVPTYK